MTVREYKEGIPEYAADLKEQERAEKTIKAYTADLEQLAAFLADTGAEEQHAITKADIIAYKDRMQTEGKSTATINRRIISINKYLKAMGAEQAAGTKTIKQQTANSLDGVLSTSDYERMLSAALNPSKQAQAAGLKEDMQAWAIMQTLANTGIRFNELQFFTVEALRSCSKNGNAITVTNKGKQREIPVAKSLQKILQDYCKQQDITGGYIFGTRNNTPISNEQISRRLKRIAGYARVSKDKIHPHSFRHFFGKEYMQKFGRLDELADILGHSSIATTRIYSRTTTAEKASNIDRLNLIQTKGRKNRKK